MSQRSLPMNDEVIEALKKHKYRQEHPSKRSIYKNAKNEHELVFMARTGKWIYPDSFNRSVSRPYGGFTLILKG